MHHSTYRVFNIMVFLLVEHWIEREIGQRVHKEGLIRQFIALCMMNVINLLKLLLVVIVVIVVVVLLLVVVF